MTKQVILAGEMVIGEGVLHQRDVLEALDAVAVSKVKDADMVIMGRPLRGKEPAVVTKAREKAIFVVDVNEVLTPEVGKKIIAKLSGRKLWPYEQRAMAALEKLTKPARRKKLKVA